MNCRHAYTLIVDRTRKTPTILWSKPTPERVSHQYTCGSRPTISSAPTQIPASLTLLVSRNHAFGAWLGNHPHRSRYMSSPRSITMPHNRHVVAPNAPNGSDSRNPTPQLSNEPVAQAKPRTDPTTGERAPQTRRPPLSPAPPSSRTEIRKHIIYADEARGANDFAHMGDLLVYLRRTYGERTGYAADGPAFTITALAVAEKLSTRYGYPMTSGSYSLLEKGISLPKNPERFFEAIGKVLAVDESSKYWALLRYQYLFDHARRTVGEEFAITHCPRGQHALDLLRKGEL